MSHGLTPKQEKFCLEYLECGNASEAYRLSYNVGRMKDSSVNRKAFELLQNGKIAARIDGLRAEAATVAVLTKASVLNDLSRIKDEAMRPNEEGLMTKPEAAIKSLELIGKHLGMWQPETQIGIQINTDGREPFEKILERAIIIDGGFPDSEAEKARQIGVAYMAYQRGEILPNPLVIGGLRADLFSDAPALN